MSILFIKSIWTICEYFCINGKKIDVVIIGAGIAGIASAYYLQKNFPNIRFKILESRSSVGGTWDQMRFPGVSC